MFSPYACENLFSKSPNVQPAALGFTAMGTHHSKRGPGHGTVGIGGTGFLTQQQKLLACSFHSGISNKKMVFGFFCMAAFQKCMGTTIPFPLIEPFCENMHLFHVFFTGCCLWPPHHLSHHLDLCGFTSISENPVPRTEQNPSRHGPAARTTLGTI